MRTVHRNDARRSSGVSLLEVMIALGIMGFGVMAAASAQITSTKFTRDSRVRTEAAYLAEQQMEAFQAMDGDAIEAVRGGVDAGTDPNNPLDPDPNDGTARFFNRSWLIVPDTPEDGVYTVTVTVSWIDQLGNTLNVTLSSVKTDS
ncbi:MAG: type IV pilus modification PilV family protein [Ilumatobacteraceae bacterium]